MLALVAARPLARIPLALGAWRVADSIMLFGIFYFSVRFVCESGRGESRAQMTLESHLCS